VNPIFYVVMGINALSSTIELVSKFITNQSVLKVLGDIDAVLKTAATALGGVSAQVQKGIAAGDINPSDPELGGVNAEDHKAA
jgi:hypothetical protein